MTRTKKFRSWNRPASYLYLHLLDGAVSDDTYERVLATLGAGVKTAANKIDAAANSGDPDTIEIVTDIETEIVENLLGAAYVVCQTKITAVVQAAIKARRQILKESSSFITFGDRAEQVRRLGEPFDCNYSKIEVLWQLGNYFKHREEWDLVKTDEGRDWNPSGNTKRTITVIKAAGLSLGSTGNLRTGADALGNNEYSNMMAFTKIISDWSEYVRESAWAAKRA